MKKAKLKPYKDVWGIIGGIVMFFTPPKSKLGVT